MTTDEKYTYTDLEKIQKELIHRLNSSGFKFRRDVTSSVVLGTRSFLGSSKRKIKENEIKDTVFKDIVERLHFIGDPLGIFDGIDMEKDE